MVTGRAVVAEMWTLFLLFPAATAVTQRTIYTYFTNPKTWNEARDICADQFGQLMKFDDPKQKHEVLYLDSVSFEDTIDKDIQTAGGRVWMGFHDPNNTGDYVYQDCRPSTNVLASSAGRCGTAQSSNMIVSTDVCSDEHQFICQRSIGDCWYEPFQDLSVLPTAVTGNVLLSGADATKCALECRNVTLAGGVECWAFSYEADEEECTLHYISSADANALATTPSVIYMLQGRTNKPGTVLYIRRCFEGVLDRSTYPDYSDKSSTPNSPCSSSGPVAHDDLDNICFCMASTQPPIPEPISLTEKLEEIITELTVDTKNTSSSLRKLSSAEDNRPSAIGVGYVGVAMIVTVFGGLFILDATVLYTGIKGIISLARGEQ